VYKSPLLGTFNSPRHQQKILKKLAPKDIVTSARVENLKKKNKNLTTSGAFSTISTIANANTQPGRA